MNEIKNFAWPVDEMLSSEYNEFKKKIIQMKHNLETKRIVVWGAGIRGTTFYYYLKNSGYKIEFYIDSNPQKVGGTIFEVKIRDPKDVLGVEKNIFIIISVENNQSIVEQLINEGLIENIDFLQVNTNIYEEFINKIKQQKEIDYLITGCCFLTHISMKDREAERADLENLLLNKFGKNNTKVLAMHGFPMGSFYQTLRTQILLGMVPKHLVMFVNLSSFPNKYGFFPRALHIPLWEKINSECNIEDQELQNYLLELRKRGENFKADLFVENSGLVDKNEIDKIVKLNFRMKYLTSIEEDSENIIYLKKVAKLCSQKNIKFCLGIDPVNYQLGERLFGNRFRDCYQKNISLVKKIVGENGGILLDLSYVLESKYFADFDTVTEVCNYAGRSLLADYIYKKLCEENNLWKKEY